jgi:hypothetical protein
MYGSGYGLDDREIGVQFSAGKREFLSQKRRNGLWGPSSLLFIGNQGHFPGVTAAWI